VLDSAPEFRIVGYAVLRTKRFPGKARRQRAEANEKAAANDEIVRSVQFEEKGNPRLQETGYLSARRLPEVDFIRRLSAQALKPGSIGNADPEFHGR